LTNDLLSLLIGVCSAIVTILILQLWPVRYSWFEDVSRTVGYPSGRPNYRVKLIRPRRWLFENRRREELTLETVLESGSDAMLRVYVFDYRPYMGTRWTVRRKYLASDIKPWIFLPEPWNRRCVDRRRRDATTLGRSGALTTSALMTGIARPD